MRATGTTPKGKVAASVWEATALSLCGKYSSCSAPDRLSSSQSVKYSKRDFPR